MKIEDVEVRTVGPQVQRYSWSHDLPEQYMTNTLVRIRTDEGVEGLGAVSNYTSFSFDRYTAETLRHLIPLILGMDPLQREDLWRRMRSRVYRWYKRLRALEGQLREGVQSGDVEGYLSELERMNHDVKNVSIPWAYAEQLYHLRVHINYVRETLESREQGAKERAV